MSIIKLNNRSVKDVTAFGSISSLGSLTHIATQTASSSASINFTSGIDSTYKEYLFILNNIHNSEADRNIFVNFSADTGSNYNVTKTTTFVKHFIARGNVYHAANIQQDNYVAGYCNVTVAIDAGTIKLYGIKDS